MPFCTHTAIDQNLGHGIFGGWVFFFLPRFIKGLDIVNRVVVADKLEGISNALNKVFLFDDCHGLHSSMDYFIINVWFVVVCY